MNIYVTHSSSFDYQDELYKPLRESELNKLHTITLPHEKSSEVFDSKEFLKTCNLVIAEVSIKSTSEGIELGWANGYGVPIIFIYKKGTEISPALHTVSHIFIEYENSDDLIKKVSDFLKLFVAP